MNQISAVFIVCRKVGSGKKIIKEGSEGINIGSVVDCSVFRCFRSGEYVDVDITGVQQKFVESEVHEGELFIFVDYNILQIEFAVTDFAVERIGEGGSEINNPGTGFFQRNGLHVLCEVVVLKRFAGEIRGDVIRERCGL